MGPRRPASTCLLQTCLKGAGCILAARVSRWVWMGGLTRTAGRVAPLISSVNYRWAHHSLTKGTFPAAMVCFACHSSLCIVRKDILVPLCTKVYDYVHVFGLTGKRAGRELCVEACLAEIPKAYMQRGGVMSRQGRPCLTTEAVRGRRKAPSDRRSS